MLSKIMPGSVGRSRKSMKWDVESFVLFRLLQRSVEIPIRLTLFCDKEFSYGSLGYACRRFLTKNMRFVYVNIFFIHMSYHM